MKTYKATLQAGETRLFAAQPGTYVRQVSGGKCRVRASLHGSPLGVDLDFEAGKAYEMPAGSHFDSLEAVDLTGGENTVAFEVGFGKVEQLRIAGSVNTIPGGLSLRDGGKVTVTPSMDLCQTNTTRKALVLAWDPTAAGLLEVYDLDTDGQKFCVYMFPGQVLSLPITDGLRVHSNEGKKLCWYDFREEG